MRRNKAEIGAWWVVTQRKVSQDAKTELFDDAEVNSEEARVVADMDDEDLHSPRQTPGPAQSTVWIDSGISIEVFIVGAQEIEWKVHTEISSLGHCDGITFVRQSLVSLMSCRPSSHHNMSVCFG